MAVPPLAPSLFSGPWFIFDSTVTQNTTGLKVTGTPAVTLHSSVLAGNASGDIVGTPALVELGPNQCGTNTTCP